jgi:hypothetical protein
MYEELEADSVDKSDVTSVMSGSGIDKGFHSSACMRGYAEISYTDTEFRLPLVISIA